ncbi:MAG: tetratricopeptide repeat protein [Acidobacteria bacterium]|nr:tetratricopeptide repeat protein [Acidobacteriota bacterium]
MPTANLKALEARALALAKNRDFGREAVQVNTAILELAPEHELAWTRLGRSHLEQRAFDDAIVALRRALALNPHNRIAANLLDEVRRQRALAPPSVARAQTGFGVREFTLLETLPPVEACRALKTRVDALFDSLNATSIAHRIVEARQTLGARNSVLFQANSLFPGGAGHIYAVQYGGRWEPQFKMGWFASPPLPEACFCAGIGFNLSGSTRDPNNAEGQERVLACFERFQQVVAGRWEPALVQWMAAAAGFIQFGEDPPLVDLVPEQAIDRLLAARNGAALGRVFCGRWLFLEKPDDAAVLGDRSKLARAIEDTFGVWYPVWLSVYAPPA